MNILIHTYKHAYIIYLQPCIHTGTCTTTTYTNATCMHAFVYACTSIHVIITHNHAYILTNIHKCTHTCILIDFMIGLVDRLLDLLLSLVRLCSSFGGSRWTSCSVVRSSGNVPGSARVGHRLRHGVLRRRRSGGLRQSRIHVSYLHLFTVYFLFFLFHFFLFYSFSSSPSPISSSSTLVYFFPLPLLLSLPLLLPLLPLFLLLYSFIPPILILSFFFLSCV